MIAWLDVNGDNFRGKARGIFERLLGNLAPMLDGHDNDGPRCFVGGDGGSGAARGNADHVIVTAHATEKEDEQGDEDDGDPGTFGKFRDENNDDRDSGNKSA